MLKEGRNLQGCPSPYIWDRGTSIKDAICRGSSRSITPLEFWVFQLHAWNRAVLSPQSQVVHNHIWIGYGARSVSQLVEETAVGLSTEVPKPIRRSIHISCYLFFNTIDLTSVLLERQCGLRWVRFKVNATAMFLDRARNTIGIHKCN